MIMKITVVESGYYLWWKYLVVYYPIIRGYTQLLCTKLLIMIEFILDKVLGVVSEL